MNLMSFLSGFHTGAKYFLHVFGVGKNTKAESVLHCSECIFGKNYNKIEMYFSWKISLVVNLGKFPHCNFWNR